MPNIIRPFSPRFPGEAVIAWRSKYAPQGSPVNQTVLLRRADETDEQWEARKSRVLEIVNALAEDTDA